MGEKKKKKRFHRSLFAIIDVKHARMNETIEIPKISKWNIWNEFRRCGNVTLRIRWPVDRVLVVRKFTSSVQILYIARDTMPFRTNFLIRIVCITAELHLSNKNIFLRKVNSKNCIRNLQVYIRLLKNSCQTNNLFAREYFQFHWLQRKAKTYTWW